LYLRKFSGEKNIRLNGYVSLFERFKKLFGGFETQKLSHIFELNTITQPFICFQMKQRQIVLLFFFLLSCSTSFGQDSEPVRNTIINNGIGLGGAIAVAISWSRNKSILWVIIHGLFGWLYVIYYYFTRQKNEA
jgi:hypothetical protein